MARCDSQGILIFAAGSDCIYVLYTWTEKKCLTDYQCLVFIHGNGPLRLQILCVDAERGGKLLGTPLSRYLVILFSAGTCESSSNV